MPFSSFPRGSVASFFCIVLAASGFLAMAKEDQRLGQTVTPVSESVRLTLDAAQPAYTGSARIELQVRQEVSSFRFHAQEMTLDRVVLTAAGGREIPLEHQPGDLGLVTLSFKEPLAPGAYSLDIDFSARFGTRAVGLYRVEQANLSYTFSQFEADDARRAFPCWDEPSFKIPYQLTMVVPEGHMAVTNTPVEKETVTAGWRTTVFRKTPPLPSYLLAIATGPFDTLEIPGMSIPGRVVTVKGKKNLAALAAASTPPLLAALEKYFDRKYPFEKLDLIAVPDYWPGAMENPGAITFSEPLLLVDQASGSPAQIRNLERTTAHELAHMWFGDLVTMEWWDDLWLNESFADWMGDKIASQVSPEFRLDLSELQSVEGTMSGDARPSAQAIRRHIDPADNKLENVGTAYNKGKTVLGMFETWAGPEKFRQGVLDYLQAHAGGNATASDLWSAVSKAAGRDMRPAMESFLDQAGLPLVSVEPVGEGSVRISQSRFANFGVRMPQQNWQIPLTLKYSDGATTRTKTLLLDKEAQTVDLGGPIAWVLPDAEASGYYRWSVPPAMLRRMADDAPRTLSDRERIGFLGNLSALLDAGAIHGDDYLNVLGKFSADPQPLVLSEVLGSLEKVKFAFVPDESRTLFAGYVRATLGPALERFGLAGKPGEAQSVSMVRPQLIGWLGVEGEDTRVLEQARTLAKTYMADPKAVDPSLAAVALRLDALDGDRALFDEFRRRFETATTPQERERYLGALGSFRDPAISEEAVKYSLEGKLRPQEIFQVTRGMGSTSKGRDRLFQFITENYPTIISRIPPQFAGFMPFFAAGCEPQRLEAAKTFFADPAHSAQGTSTTLARVTDMVNDCVSLRQREGAAVSAFLSQAGASR
ncbi:MAG TPA: M1 family metallopeptidase [Patescibacteria group bacterium]|nr:M1 family metallopeptidase [Patescibacteria group bacterium]